MSRKYRQRGYQDEQRPDRTRRPPAERREGPRGRGLGAPTAAVFRCRECNRRLDVAPPVAFDATCRECGAALHSCTHCAHFDAGAPLECRLEIPERIARKAAANRCELFEIRWTTEFADEAPSRSSAAQAFDDLFDF